MPLTPEELEERLLVLEKRNRRLERLLHSGRAFTNNPLAQATDLDDLGSVKTHLDFEEAPLTPVDPPTGVGRMSAAARTGLTDTSLRYVDASGVVSEVTHPPMTRVYNSAGITIANVTPTYLTFNTERFDTDSMHSTSSNTGRITATTPGRYLFIAHVKWAVVAARLITGIVINRSFSVGSAEGKGVAGTNLTQSFPAGWTMAAGDYVEVQVYQDSGGDTDVQLTNALSPEFEAYWLGP